jgi:predicted transposase/invertase (TIGR01784 family)
MNTPERRAHGTSLSIIPDENLTHAFMRRMAIYDCNTSINAVRREGIEEGIKKSIEEKRNKIVKNLYAKDMSIQQISSITELTEQDVYTLLNSQAD